MGPLTSSTHAWKGSFFLPLSAKVPCILQIAATSPPLQSKKFSYRAESICYFVSSSWLIYFYSNFHVSFAFMHVKWFWKGNQFYLSSVMDNIYSFYCSYIYTRLYNQITIFNFIPVFSMVSVFCKNPSSNCCLFCCWQVLIYSLKKRKKHPFATAYKTHNMMLFLHNIKLCGVSLMIDVGVQANQSMVYILWAVFITAKSNYIWARLGHTQN